VVSHEEYYFLVLTRKTPVRIENVTARHWKKPRLGRLKKIERIGWTYPADQRVAFERIRVARFKSLFLCISSSQNRYALLGDLH
jgi:hypothetical protein